MPAPASIDGSSPSSRATAATYPQTSAISPPCTASCARDRGANGVPSRARMLRTGSAGPAPSVLPAGQNTSGICAVSLPPEYHPQSAPGFAPDSTPGCHHGDIWSTPRVTIRCQRQPVTASSTGSIHTASAKDGRHASSPAPSGSTSSSKVARNISSTGTRHSTRYQIRGSSISNTPAQAALDNTQIARPCGTPRTASTSVGATTPSTNASAPAPASSASRPGRRLCRASTWSSSNRENHTADTRATAAAASSRPRSLILGSSPSHSTRTAPPPSAAAKKTDR